MTKPVTLLPAMCRRNMLSDDMMRKMEGLFSCAGVHGLKAITLPIFYDGENLHALAGMRYVMSQNGHRHQRATDTGLVGSIEEQARDLGLLLMQDQAITSDLEDVDADYVIFQSAGTYCLTFFPGCAIIYPDDPVARLISDSYEIGKNPDLIANRAQICALILEDVVSQHQRAAQPPKVLQALGEWRLMTGIFAPGVEHEAGLRLQDPAQVDIMACENDCIER